MKEPKICSECGKEAKRLNRKRCDTCYARYYRTYLVSDESLKKAYEWRKKYRELNKDKILANRKKKRQENRAYFRRMRREGHSSYTRKYARSPEYITKVLVTREKVNKFKMDKGCIDCDYNKHPEALDFDHLPEFEKKYEVSRLARSNAAPETLWAEIAKCEVRCTNCHRIKTYERRLAQKTN